MFPITDIVKAGLEVFNKLVPDKEGQLNAEREFLLKMQDLAQKTNSEQNEINKIEAAHSNIFVAGWRPFIGWICGAAFAWQYVLAPVLAWVIAIYRPEIKLPNLEIENIFELCMAMLGLGGLRTFEKVKKVNKF